MTRLRIGLGLASVFAASLALAQAGEPRHDQRHSGYHDMGPALQKMQDDDTANPAMLFVQAGEALWQQKAGAAGKSCADCHKDAAMSMKGVAARYPAIPAGANQPVDLEGRINLCRTTQQQAPALAAESARAARTHSLCNPAVARPADRATGRSAPGAIPQSRRGNLQRPARPAQSFLRQLPR